MLVSNYITSAGETSDVRKNAGGGVAVEIGWVGPFRREPGRKLVYRAAYEETKKTG